MFKTKLKLKYLHTKEDGKKYYALKAPLYYDKFIVPTGFVTDLASVPLTIRKFSSKLHLYLLKKTKKSATLHDFLYSTNLPRKVCDDLFYEAMEDEKVNWFIRDIFYYAVRFKGHKYRKNGVA